MRSFEIFVARDPRGAALSAFDPRTAPRDPGDVRKADVEHPRPHSVPAREVLEIFIGGANVSALASGMTSPSPAGELAIERDGAIARRTTPARANAGIAGAMRDLGTQVARLCGAPRGKAIVRLYDEPWELCVERLGASAALSVYRSGADPTAIVYDRVVPFGEVVSSLREALAEMVAREAAPAPLLVELRAAEQALASARPTAIAEELAPPLVPAVVAIDGEAAVSFGAEFELREGAARPARPGDGPTGRSAAEEPCVERTDMHALLFRGKLAAEVRGHAVDLGEGHPFLLAERLVVLAQKTLDAWERGTQTSLRAEVGAVIVGVRLEADGGLALTLGAPRRDASRAFDPARAVADGAGRGIYTFPVLTVEELAEGAIAYGRALTRAILRHDRSQAQNLRLTAFRRQLRETQDLLREACKDDALVNPSPESYRAFAAPPSSRERAAAGAGGRAASPARLRYSSRWRALVPGIDLKSTFLCGDRLVVGASAETFCLDRATGEVLWRVPTERATSVVTPGGVARLHADGELCVHDFGTGDVTLRSWLVPRTGGPPAGAVVNVPGLPRLLISTEGEKHLVAIDLASGEPRWRFAWGKKGTLRLKRAGKLLYFTCGDTALTALDVLTGAVVWRARDRLRFHAAPVLDHDALFAIAGGASTRSGARSEPSSGAPSRAHLLSVDAFSGSVLWKSALAWDGAPVAVEGAPLVAGESVICAVRDRRGLRLIAHARATGEPLWRTPGYVAPAGTSWLVVDDLLIGNTPTGELVGVETDSGATRYRHKLGATLETDIPRRLEPVLRSGALFVPHSDVFVVRPRDGGVVGVVGPCETIPDLLRVDERCDVYVAEESGHLASFAAGPRLELVR